MSALKLQRRKPSVESLQRLAGVVAPGSRPANVRRLRGGISAVMHALDLVRPDGERLRLVVRRFVPAPEHETAHAQATRFYQTLQLVEQLGLPAPRPVLLDQVGEIFGESALVMTRAPGRALLSPHDTESWSGQLAAALLAIHRAPLDGHEVGFLPGPGQVISHAFAHLEYRSGGAYPPDRTAVIATIERWRPYIRSRPPVLVHGDFWAGNTLWLRGRLNAVVDWEDACIDSPEADVSTCRLDLCFSHGEEAADRFLRLYEKAAGEAVERCFFWDLVAAAHVPPDPADRLPGYHDLGLTALTPELLRVRLRAFIANALARAAAAEPQPVQPRR